MDASDKISRDVMLKRCDISGEKDDDAKERVTIYMLSKHGWKFLNCERCTVREK